MWPAKGPADKGPHCSVSIFPGFQVLSSEPPAKTTQVSGIKYFLGLTINYLQSHHSLPPILSPPRSPQRTHVPTIKLNTAQHQLGTESKGCALSRLAFFQAKHTYVNPTPLLPQPAYVPGAPCFSALSFCLPTVKWVFPSQPLLLWGLAASTLTPHPGTKCDIKGAPSVAICPCHANVYAIWAGERERLQGVLLY